MPMIDADKADDESDAADRYCRNIKPRLLEAHLSRQAMHPGVAAGTAQRHALSAALAQDRAHAFRHHQPADRTEQDHVGQTDGDVELTDTPQKREQPDAGNCADSRHRSAGQAQAQNRPPCAASRRSRRKTTTRRCGLRRSRPRPRALMPDENQQRRHQEPAADAEHAGDKSDRKTHTEYQEDIDRQIRDRKINFHEPAPETAAVATWPSTAATPRTWLIALDRSTQRETVKILKSDASQCGSGAAGLYPLGLGLCGR